MLVCQPVTGALILHHAQQWTPSFLLPRWSLARAAEGPVKWQEQHRCHAVFGDLSLHVPALLVVSFVPIDDPSGRWATKSIESWDHIVILGAGYHGPQSRKASPLNLRS